MDFKPGDKLGDRYLLSSKLGSGGMGEVWKARDTELDRDVAVKVSKAEFTARFRQEARTIAAFNHPNICQIHDVGPNYLVMELIDGAQLSGPMPVEKAVAYAGQILDALDAAHRKGFTHRDLKPANVMVTKSGILKLLDFGLAKQAMRLQDDAPTVAALSVQGQIAGTLQYMAPEQLQGKEVDARSDIFSFGCVLYEMLSGGARVRRLVGSQCDCVDSGTGAGASEGCAAAGPGDQKVPREGPGSAVSRCAGFENGAAVGDGNDHHRRLAAQGSVAVGHYGSLGVDCGWRVCSSFHGEAGPCSRNSSRHRHSANQRSQLLRALAGRAENRLRRDHRRCFAPVRSRARLDLSATAARH